MTRKSDKETIGERLRKLRESKKMTADELGKIVGYSRQNISKLENNKTTISTENLIRYADYFDVSTDYILGRDGDHKKKSTAELGLSLGLEEKSVLALQMLNELNISDLGINDDPFGYFQNAIDSEIVFSQKGINLLLSLLYNGLVEAENIKNTPGHSAGTIGNLFSHIYMYINAIRFGIGDDPKIQSPHFIFNDEQAPPHKESMIIKYANGGIGSPFHACELFWAYYRTKILNDLNELITPYDRRFAREYIIRNSKTDKEKKGGKANGKHTAKRK